MNALESPKQEQEQEPQIERQNLLRSIYRKYAPEAPSARDHQALGQLEHLCQRLPLQDPRDLDPLIDALNRDGYLSGALVQLSQALLECWDLGMATRLAAELSDGLDPVLGEALANLIADDPKLDADPFAQRETYIDVQMALGDTSLQAGQSARALRHYEAVLAVDIRHPQAAERWSAAAQMQRERGHEVRSHGRQSPLIDGIEELRMTEALDSGRYELGRALGRGRHAIVYQAYDRHVGRHVAVKQLLHAQKTERGTSVLERRFLQEAQTLARVRSQHVVPLYDVDPQGRYIAMELCRAGSLRQQLRQRQIQPKHALSIAHQLRKALKAVHMAGAVHRDIKPANILVRHVDPLPEIVLADFGLALGAQRKRSGAAGTLRYLAPELRAGNEATNHSDRFSAGVVILEIALSPSPLPRLLDQLGMDHRPAQILQDLSLAEPIAELLSRLLSPVPQERTWEP